jgi:hypothetical protein
MTTGTRITSKHIIVLLIAFVVLFDSAGGLLGTAQASVLAPKRRETNYRLHTEGKMIEDLQGNTVTLRGAAVFRRWMWAESWKNFDPLAYSDENQAKYNVYAMTGANFIRVELNKWLWDNANPTYTRALDTLVSWCEQNGLMVVLTFQSYDFYNYTSGAYTSYTKQQRVDYILNGTMQGFMVNLATRYKNQLNVVGLEIMPERPNDKFWASYRGITREQSRAEYRDSLISAVRAIHNVEPNYIVFVYPPNDDELGTFVLEAPIAEPNVVYCQMRYVSWDKGWRAYSDAYYKSDPNASTLLEQDYQSMLFNVMDQGYPVMLMETGTELSLPNVTTYVNDLCALFKKHQVGICWWTFDREPLFGYAVLLRSAQGSDSTLSTVGLAWSQQMKQWSFNSAS